MKQIMQGLLLVLILCCTQPAHAWWFNQGSDCNTNCKQYECSCNALHCGAFDVQLQAGVDPIIWRSKAEVISGSFPFPSPTNPTLVFFNSPSYKRLFHVPWIVGGQVGYAWSDNVRFFVEFNYMQAKGKDNVSVSTATTPVLAATFTVHKYKLFDAYVGGRYYWDRWCNRIAFFLGGKIGLTHHKNTKVDLAVGIPLLPPVSLILTKVPAINHNTGISGGVNAGFDICFCGNWSVVITGEVVASQGPKIANNIPLSQVVGQYNAISFGNIGAELRFPVTAAIRYTF